MKSTMAQGLPTPPVEETKPQSHPYRRSSSSKHSKTIARSTKRASSSLSHEHSSTQVMDGRHKRVWKACERCRMKKTKCDGESPCKRCKDDGLVCTAGSRKKTEFKQLPRGYAEVLENTQYALIATVQKLYQMVRNNESWELGEPELNDRGMPVIHNIAEKLGCIRPSPDLPCAFPEDAEEFAALQARLEATEHEGVADGARRKFSEDSERSSHSRSHRASSNESDHSQLSKDYNQMAWAQQQQQPQGLGGPHFDLPTPRPQDSRPDLTSEFKQEPIAMAQAMSSFNPRTTASPVYNNFRLPNTESPTYPVESPFSPWSAGDDFLGPASMLDITAGYMRQTHQRHSFPQAIPRSAPLLASMDSSTHSPLMQSPMRLSDAQMINPSAFTRNSYLSESGGTIRPNMLECNTGFDLADQMDNVMFADY